MTTTAAAPEQLRVRDDAEFAAAVKAYIELHDQLAEAGKRTREMRKDKAALADALVAFMRDADIGQCELSDGKLVRKCTKRLSPLRKDDIMEGLKEAVGAPRAEDIMLGLASRRSVTEVETLRRTRKRA